MSDQVQPQKSGIYNLLHNPKIDEYIFILLIMSSFIGELMMTISMMFGFIYWMTITPVFFIASIISEKAKNIQTGRDTPHLIRYQFFYWGSAFVAVILTFLLWDMDRIGPSEASIVIHIILAHTMFLTGIVLGLRFYLIGILLFITAALNITTQLSLGFSLDIVVIAFITWLGLKVKHLFFLPTLKRKDDFIKSNESYSGQERRDTN